MPRVQVRAGRRGRKEIWRAEVKEGDKEGEQVEGPGKGEGEKEGEGNERD